MGLIPDVRHRWHRLWSIQLNAIGLALQTLLMTWATLPLDLWNMMPGEVKAFLPPQLVFALPAIFFAASMLARLVKQKPKHEDVSKADNAASREFDDDR